MKFKQKPVVSAVTLALMGVALGAQAQQPQKQAPTETIFVTGIRAAVEKSLETKRNADSVVEVITAEDIGKMPDKNIADSLQRVTGVTISSQAGGSGGFDENDRVSIRGTNPSLTQTLVNGHSIASGDWFVLDQVTAVGRSVSFSLLPSEIVSQVIVRKSATADLVEGGVAGAVDIITRKPLEFVKPVTAEATVGTVYADLPDKWDPQVNGLINWKNDAGTMGVLLQGFYEKRHLRRDGQETIGYEPISAAIVAARPQLAGVVMPSLIGSSFFEQERERKGGLIDIQIRPTNDLELDLNAFTSRMDATNYNRNWMMWGSRINSSGRIPTSFTVTNGTLTAATWAGAPEVYAVVDDLYRPGAFSETNYVNLDAKFRASDKLTFFGQVGSSTGKGETPKHATFEGDVTTTGVSYTMHGISSPVDVAFTGVNPAVFTGTTLDWVFGASPARSDDKEKYAKADGEWQLDQGMFNAIKFGARWAEHRRETTQVAQGPNFAAPNDPFNPANFPAWNGQTYPSDFASGLGGNFPRNVWMIDPGVLEAWGDIYSNRDPKVREFWSGEFALKETTNAGYVMATFDGKNWAGNAGLRYVRTEEKVTVNVGLPNCPVMAPCPGAPAGTITTSAFGSFYKSDVVNTYNDWLPSANFKYDLQKDMVLRFAAARTIARPDYSALGGAISADDTTHTGNGGNPNLKPIRSNNFDASWEWYFAPRSLVSVGLFHMDLTNYVAYGTYKTTLLNIKTGAFESYTITAPINSKGTVSGVELSYQQPLGMGFGVQANYTYADAKEKKTCDPSSPAYQSCLVAPTDLVGASKNTYNIGGYYEDHGFGAHINYTFRSAFFVGLDRSSPQYQDDTGTLSASLSYTFSKNFSIQLDANNLNDPTLKYYGKDKDQPRAFYTNGRQYYAGLRMKF
jgi:iron complex outermembrane recepter protein